MTRLACSIRRVASATVVLPAIFAPLRPAPAGTQYTVVELGVGSSAVTNAVNASGETAGVISIATAFHYDNVVVTPLPGLPEYPLTYGRGINAAGTVAGNCRSPTIPPFPVVIPAIWQGTTLTVINMGGVQGGEARDISDSGQVVGWSDSFGTERAFLWDGANFVQLGTLHENPGGSHGGYLGKSQAFAINNNNQIVGWAATDDYPGVGSVGFIYTIGQGMSSLGLYQGVGTGATDLNDAATVAAYADLPSGRVALRWQEGKFIDLGNLGGTYVHPNGINNAGQIVGSSTLMPQSGASHAFIWQRGVMTDLNTLLVPGTDWVVGFAYDINESGQIAAMGSHGAEFTQRAVRLDPVVPPPAPGDIDRDGSVNGADLGLLLGSWGPCVGCPADLNGDGTVDGADLGILLGLWTG